MIGAVELDPNQIVVTFGAVLVAFLAFLGVIWPTLRRVKSVAHEATPNGGGNLYAKVEGIDRQMTRLEKESSERWDVIASVQESVTKIHLTQLNVIRSTEPLIAELSRLAGAQQTFDLRLGQVEVNTAERLAEMRAVIGALQMRIDALSGPLTPPHGTPAVKTK